MTRAGSSSYLRLATILSCALVLAACDTASNTGADPLQTAPAPSSSGPGPRVIERDVESPDIFQAEDAGLWDGRPSLGGVWVAHPNVRDPERALIRNMTTGATVIGALFRRERDNPGPRFQVSSEAANALGLLAGAPTDISVTALRLQRIEMEIDPEPEAATAVDETLAIAPVAVPEAAAETPAQASPLADPEVTLQGETAAEEQPPARRSLRDLFRRRDAAPDTAIAQTALAPAAGAVVAGGEAVAAAVPEAAEPPRQRRTLGDLFRRRPAEPEPSAPDTQDAATVAPEPQTVVQAPGPRLDRPFVQIGIFSVEQNAQNARAQMQRAGLSAEIRRGRVGDNLFWRVVVGPAGTTGERSAMLRQVRSLGFTDAYAVVR